MFIKTTFNSDLNHILNCVNKCDFGTKCFAKVEHFVLRLIIYHYTIAFLKGNRTSVVLEDLIFIQLSHNNEN